MLDKMWVRFITYSEKKIMEFDSDEVIVKLWNYLNRTEENAVHISFYDDWYCIWNVMSVSDEVHELDYWFRNAQTFCPFSLTTR